MDARFGIAFVEASTRTGMWIVLVDAHVAVTGLNAAATLAADVSVKHHWMDAFKFKIIGASIGIPGLQHLEVGISYIVSCIQRFIENTN